MKTLFQQISLQAYMELVRFRKFQKALIIVIVIFEIYDANIVS